MSTFKERNQYITNEVQSIEFQLCADFIDYIKFVENGIRKGYNYRSKKWFPYKSYEGGSDTIAYGHKIKKGENFVKGITNQQANKLLIDDLITAREQARFEVDSQYGGNTFDQLPIKHQEMLIDFTFNLGSLRSFPKFTRAVVRNDYIGISNEYKRYSKGRELTGRNNEFYNRYIEPLIFKPTKNPTFQ